MHDEQNTQAGTTDSHPTLAGRSKTPDPAQVAHITFRQRGCCGQGHGQLIPLLQGLRQHDIPFEIHRIKLGHKRLRDAEHKEWFASRGLDEAVSAFSWEGIDVSKDNWKVLLGKILEKLAGTLQK